MPAILIREMTRADLPLGLRLKDEAGWNQTEADWVRFLDLQPDGCFVAELNAVPVATVTTCLFETIAWIAMMLVDRAVRGRGIGRALMVRALEFLEAHGARTVRLDATALGQPLYEGLGFVAESRVDRFEGTLPDAGPISLARPPALHEMNGVRALDRSATGTDRARLLLRLAAEHPDAVRVAGRDGAVDGFLLARPGSRACQIGPCFASESAGPILLADAWSRYAGLPVIIDIPTANSAATAIALSQGLTARRQFLRMCRGERVVEDPRAIWASSGPEMG